MIYVCVCVEIYVWCSSGLLSSVWLIEGLLDGMRGLIVYWRLCGLLFRYAGCALLVKAASGVFW